MKTSILATVISLLFLFPVSGLADMLVLEPTPADLYDLDHYRAYSWGLSIEEDVSLILVTDVVLSFDNIRNWDRQSNVLYVHLLDYAPDGVTSHYDGQGGGDHFAGQGIELVTYVDLPNTAQDLQYDFSEAQIDTFNDYLQDGSVAFGFDPDCHFYNDGVSLSICYEVIQVPEPGMLVLICLGAVGVVPRRGRS